MTNEAHVSHALRMWEAAENDLSAWKIRVRSLKARFEEIRDQTTDGNARAIAKNTIAQIESWS